MGRAGEFAPHDPLHFLELLHQVYFRMEATCRVDDEHARRAGLGCADRVEDDGGGVGVGGLPDQRDIHPFCPDFQLLDGRRPECVGGDERHRAALLFQVAGKFADGRGLPPCRSPRRP